MMRSPSRPGRHPGGGPLPAGDPASALLSAARLSEALRGRGSMWGDIRVLDETGSTNEDMLAQAQAGAAEGMVIAAQAQRAGRGRQGRAWHSAPGGALTFSVLLRPGSVPQPVRGWVPLLAGVATATALREVTGVDARLKWPNDVLIGAGKLARILAEQAGDAVGVGVGHHVLGPE